VASQADSSEGRIWVIMLGKVGSKRFSAQK